MLSYLLLRIRLEPFRVFALFAVVIGVCLVGVSPILIPDQASNESNDEDKHLPELKNKLNGTSGILIILAAQIIQALQFVVEEKIMTRYTVHPIKMVGLEGFFGMATIFAVMSVVYPLFGHDTDGLLDIGSGAKQILADINISSLTIASTVVVGAFYYFGMAITHHVCATTRSTVDCSRTLFIWLISLALGWEVFNWIQVIGFLVLLYGTFVYNRVIPAYPKIPGT
jgi:hypothetical protein